MKKLTDKEIKFVEEYVANGYNGSRAYQITYSTNNKNLAKAESWSMLRKTHIQEAIVASEKSCWQIARENGLDRKSILLELKKIIKSNFSARERLVRLNALLKITDSFSPVKTEIDFSFNERRKIDTSNMSPEEIKQLSYKIAAEM